MAFTPTLTTYAISLHFPPDVNAIISSAVKAISELTGNTFILKNKIPPHVTIGAFYAAKEDEAKLLNIIEDFSKNLAAGLIQFSEVGDFNKKVLFLKPEKDEFLSKINSELHAILLPEFEKAENGYYLPEIWFPHTTLATRLNQSLFSKAQEIARQIPLPLKADVSEIAVYQCSPFAELKRFNLAQ